jgi:hypothetical protein
MVHNQIIITLVFIAVLFILLQFSYHKTVNVLFCVRDGGKYLDKNLTLIENFCKNNFTRYNIFFIENDSVDDTIKILQSRKNLIGTFNTLDSRHSSDMCASDEIFNCGSRTSFLAKLRQRVLEKSLEYSSDITMVCDIDFISFDPKELSNMIDILIEHKFDGIFGMSYTSDGAKYDTPAIVARPPMTHDDVLRSIDTSDELIRVNSAFSGFGVYRTKSILQKHARYNVDTQSIEHIDFNKYFDKLYIYPKFRPVYCSSSLKNPCIY